MLAKRWAFPEHLIDCIRDHHNPDAEPSAMMDCLRVADQVVRYREVGDSGNPWRETEAIAARRALVKTWRPCWRSSARWTRSSMTP
jgi:HD-like signal output (HDOD) protein